MWFYQKSLSTTIIDSTITINYNETKESVFHSQVPNSDVKMYLTENSNI